MNHEEAVEILKTVLNFYPDSYQNGEELSVIIQSNEQYTVGATVALHPRSDEHRVVVLELAFRPMSFFRLNRSTQKAVKKLTKKTSEESSVHVAVGQDQRGSVQCLISKTYWAPVDGKQVDFDHAKMAALAMVAFGLIKESQ
jgi:hypothetical protein